MILTTEQVITATSKVISATTNMILTNEKKITALLKVISATTKVILVTEEVIKTTLKVISATTNFKMAARNFQLNGTLMILVFLLIFWRQLKPNSYRCEDVNTTDPAYAFMPVKTISFRYMTSLNFLIGRMRNAGAGKCKQSVAVTVSKQYLLLPLIVAGDISPNPGPQANYYCQVCEGQIIPGDVRTFCSYCQNWIHVNCTNNWMCSLCSDSAPADNVYIFPAVLNGESQDSAWSTAGNLECK